MLIRCSFVFKIYINLIILHTRKRLVYTDKLNDYTNTEISNKELRIIFVDRKSLTVVSFGSGKQLKVINTPVEYRFPRKLRYEEDC